MPIPVVHFTKSMTSEERLQSLYKMRDWCESPEANESKIKADILTKFINYAFNNLIVISRFGFRTSDQMKDLECQIYDAIFYHADLPELLFLQHVMNQLNLIEIDTNPIKNEILPIVKQKKDTLMIPIIRETHIANGGVIVLALWVQNGWFLAACLLTLFCAELITNLRIENELKNKLALKETGGNVSRIDDRYENAISGISKYSSKGYHAVISFFNTSVLPAIIGEKKETPKPSL